MLAAAAIGHEFAANQDAEEARRIEVEVLLERTKRMRAIGELAGGVAHEFNNLLAVIGGTASTLRSEGTGHGDVDEALGDIERAVRRGSEISGELLAFARGQEDTGTQRTRVVESLEACVRLVLPVMGRSTQVRTDFASDLPDAAVAPRTIEQAVVNVALNSKAAMPGGGELHIFASLVEVSAAEGQALAIAPGPWLQIRVRDNGSGMDAETLARIYEPFFTTKEDGTGLGLAVVFGLLQRAGGCVRMESEVGVGTETSMYLPIASPSEETAENNLVVAPSPSVRRTGRVLLVDDQAAVRKMARRILTRAGYEVREASNGLEALSQVTQEADFDLVLSDVSMPRMGGARLAEELDAAGHHMPVVFMTGFAGSDENELFRGVSVLHKPFAPDALLRVVDMALANEVSGKAAPARRHASRLG